MQMHLIRRLMSSQERNRVRTVAACPKRKNFLGENGACCPVARATSPSEVSHDINRRADRSVGEEADQDFYQDPLLTYTEAGGRPSALPFSDNSTPFHARKPLFSLHTHAFRTELTSNCV
jgi:hypothetical protein